MKGIRSIGRNAGLLFASQTSASVARAVYAVVVARLLGPELYGLFAYGLAWYGAFLAIANLYLEAHMSRQVALSPSSAKEVLSQTLVLRSLSVSSALVLALVTAFFEDENSKLFWCLIVFSLAMAGRSTAMWCTSAFVASEKAGHAFNNEIAFRLLEVIVGVVALLAGCGVFTLSVIHALSWWGQAAFGFILVRRHLVDVRLRSNVREQVDLFKLVLPAAVASIGAAWLMQGPFVMFRHLVGSGEQLGQVALVLQVFVLISGIPVALGRAALPVLTRTVDRRDKKDAVFLGFAMRAALLGTASIVLVALAFGEWFMPAVFGDRYERSGIYVAYAAWLVLPFGIGTTVNQVLLAHDRRREAMFASVAGAIAMTLAVFVLSRLETGVPGYFAGLFGGMATWAALALWWISGDVELDWGRCLCRPVLAIVASTLFYFLVRDVLSSAFSLAAAAALLVFLHFMLGVMSANEYGLIARYLWRRQRVGE